MITKIKKLKLYFNEFQVGDIVRSYDGSNYYIVKRKGKKSFYNLRYIIRLNMTGLEDTLYEHSFDRPHIKREVMRRVVIEEKRK